MATEVGKMPGHWKAKYPWPKWTNGKKWKAEAGKDFDCPAKAFRRGLHVHAMRHNLTVETAIRDGSVFFQFAPIPAEVPKSTRKK